MYKFDTIFSKSISNLDGWEFDRNVTEVFPDMIKRSIPGYHQIISIIGILIKKFVKNNSYIYDLGCSLGNVSLEIDKNIQVKGCKILAVDHSPYMIKKFKTNLNTVSKSTKIKLLETDIFSLDIQNACIVILNFTLQFLPPKKRIYLLNRIYSGLNPGGILIISEKFKFCDQKVHKILYDIHDNFKKINQYSSLEIQQKKNMLKNILITDTIEMHIKRLKIIGFKNISLFYQCLNFGSLFAIKSLI